MANNEIDSLSIGIKVNDNNSVAKLNEMSKAIDSLVSSLDGLKKMQSVLGTLGNAFKSVGRSGSRATRRATVPNVAPPQYATAETNTSVGKLPEITGQLQKATQKATKSIKEMGDAQNRTSKATDKSASSFSKFTRSVGRIAFYRTIRTALKEITQAAREGLSNLSTVDKGLADSLNRLSASSVTLRNVFGSILSPIIKSIEPVITRFADGLATIINRIEESKAAMRGASTYTKILTSDTDEYKKSLDKAKGSLLSFDTFNVLNTNNEYAGVIEDAVKISEGEAKGIVAQIDNIKNALLGLVGVIALVKFTEIAKGIVSIKNAFNLLDAALIAGILVSIRNAIQAFKDGDIYGGILATTVGVALAGAFILLNRQIIETLALKVISFFKDFRIALALVNVSAYKVVATIGALGIGITTLTAGIISFIGSWGDMSTFKKILTIFISLAAAITAAAIAINMFSMNWGMALGIGAAVAGGALLVSTALPNFANGGSFNTADMFYANENGQTELIASTNNGGAVMNTEQLQEAIYTGMTMAMAERGGQEIVLKVDQNTLGRVVANSSGFISETNRIKLIKV